MLKGMINISIKTFFKKVVCRVLIVTPIASIIPYYITSIISPCFIRLMVTIIVTIISTSIIILFVGISKKERLYVIQQIKNHCK